MKMRAAAQGLQHVGLLGTRFTMERDFYRRRLADRYGLQVSTPDAAQRALVHRVIYDELVRGRICPKSRDQLLAIIDGLAARGAQGVVLGCTELPLLVTAADTRIPLFDTTAAHAARAVELALQA